MADYSYMNGGNNSYEKSSIGPRYNGWGTNNGYDTHSPGWGKPGYGSHDEGHRDHVCKPVIIDAQGRKKPIISYGQTPHNHMNGIVTKTETIIEQVLVPRVGYGNISPTKAGYMNDYGAVNNGWSRSGSPSHDRSPNKTSPVGSTYWGQPANSNGYSGVNGYRGNYDHGSNRRNKTSGNTKRDPYFDGYQGNHQMEQDGIQETTIVTTGGWVRPSQLGWATPPNKDLPLSRPINDIGTAIDYLQDAAMNTPVSMAPAKPWLTAPTPMVPKIDSKEARQKYGNFSESPQAVRTANTYASTIDSREAVRRYGGQIM